MENYNKKILGKIFSLFLIMMLLGSFLLPCLQVEAAEFEDNKALSVDHLDETDGLLPKDLLSLEEANFEELAKPADPQARKTENEIQPVVVPAEENDQSADELDNLPALSTENFTYRQAGEPIPQEIMLKFFPESLSQDGSKQITAHWEVFQDNGGWLLIDQTREGLNFEIGKNYRIHLQIQDLVANIASLTKLRLDNLVLTLDAETDLANLDETISAHYYSPVLSLGNALAGPATQLGQSEDRMAAPMRAGNAIYLNGDTGDDNNDGQTAGTAVKSFNKARELASAHQEINTIFVTGTVEVKGNISLTGTNAILKRDNSFDQYLLKVNAGSEASLSNIVIDGGSQDGTTASQSLIYCEGTLNLLDQAILQNNTLSSNVLTYGGAVYASNGTINLNGGTIQNNISNRGSGIFMEDSTFQMKGGAIQNNSNEEGYEGKTIFGGGLACINSDFQMSGGTISGNKGNGYGGGVICIKSKVQISGGAIQNNTAKLGGGGIVVQDSNGTVEMTGGSINGNSCDTFGGGICSINSNIRISSGIISNNKSGASGGGICLTGGSENRIDGGIITDNTSQGFWGGGGIYVEKDTTLYMSRTLITGNKVDGMLIGAGDHPASQQGGGLWNCPSGHTTM